MEGDFLRIENPRRKKTELDEKVHVIKELSTSNEAISESFDAITDKALKDLGIGDSPPCEAMPESVSDLFAKGLEALKEGDSTPPEKTPESVSDLFAERAEALKEGNLTLDHIWEVNSPPIENLPEKKSKAKEIWENLTEEGKRLELVVKAELKKRHEQAQELDQLQKNIESSAKDKVKELKVQELTLSQEGQRLQELVKTIRERRAQDKDGDFLDRLFSQGAEKISDSVTKIPEKTDASIKQTVRKASRETEKDDSDRVESSLGPIKTGESVSDLFAKQIEALKEGDSTPPEIEPPHESNPVVIKEFEKLFQKILERDDIQSILTFGYGKWIPLDLFKESKVSDLIRELDFYEKNSIKNPEIGHLLKNLEEKSQLSVKEFCKSLNISFQHYYRILKNEEGFNLKKFIQLIDLPAIKNQLNSIELNNLKLEIERIVVSKETKYKNYLAQVNFDSDVLEKAKVVDKNYVVIPTSKHEIKGMRGEVKQWVMDHFKKYGSAPSVTLLQAKFGGFISNEAKYNRGYNDFLTECGIPLNLERKYDWADLENRNMVKIWTKNFYYVTEFLNGNGRSPLYNEFKDKYTGFISYEQRHGRTFNDWLRECGLPLIHEIKRYDWSDPKNYKMVRTWTINFYYVTKLFNGIGRSPTAEELRFQFRGFFYKKRTHNNWLRECGLPINHDLKYNWSDPKNREMVRIWTRNFFYLTKFFEVNGRVPSSEEFKTKFSGLASFEQKNKRRYTDWLRECWLPVIETSQSIREGYRFDQIVKEGLKYLDAEIIIAPKIYHPSLKEFKKNFVIPDGISHDFNLKSLSKSKNIIILEKEQRIDKIIEIKSSFTSINYKEWDIYTNLAKSMDIILFKGRGKSFEKNGCRINFYNITDILNILKKKINPLNEDKIKLFFKKYYRFKRGLIDNTQKSISNF